MKTPLTQSPAENLLGWLVLVALCLTVGAAFGLCF